MLFSSKFRHTQGQSPATTGVQPVADKTACRRAPPVSCEDTNCDDHEHDHRLRKAGEQNPWISQTLRFTHIHNEKQPTKTLSEPRLEAWISEL